ncbi:MAG TPA: DUF177 domain-containing protein [Gemmatimonadaceae bacterium]
MAMLSFDVRSLEHGGATVDAVLPPDDGIWMEEDILRPLREGVRVTGRISAAGTGRYYFSGHLSGVTQQECRRCLTPVEAPVAMDVHVLYAEAGGEDDDDPDVYPLGGTQGDVIDLRLAVREQWLLEVPPFLECRPDCKGLCPKCGADLNAGACGCAPEIDPRWEALRKTRGAPN